MHCQVLVFPDGTKIAPNFDCYPNLKVAMGGGGKKIWLVSQKGKKGADGNTITSAFDDVKQYIPKLVKDKQPADRIGVAFVGEVTAADIISMVGSDNAPLKNARIWHLRDTKGLDLAATQSLKQYARGNNLDPTGLVLPLGMDVDEFMKNTDYQYKIGNIYSLSKDDNDASKNMLTLTAYIVNTGTFEIARFTTEHTRRVVLKGTKINDDIIEELKKTKRAVTADLSGLTFPNRTSETDDEGNLIPDDYILSGVTTGSIRRLLIPSGINNFTIDTYQNTTFGVIARIKTLNETEPVAVVFQRVPGTLAYTSEFRSEAIKKYSRIRYRGMMSEYDLSQIFNGNSNIRYDLSDIEIVKYKNTDYMKNPPINFTVDMVDRKLNATTADMSVISNGYVKYILMPRDTKLPDADAMKANCPLLLAMGVVENATKTFTAYSWENLDNDGNQIASIKSVTEMLEENGGDEVLARDINNLVMKGFFNAKDISAMYDGSFPSATIETADFSNAYFKNCNDMIWPNAVYSANALKSIKLPLTMTELPEGFLKDCSGLTELYIPTGYEIIGKDAFNGTSLSHIYTDALMRNNPTTGKEEVYMQGDNHDGTFTLPSSLKKISTGAFSIKDNVHITDVYVLAKEAPVCEMDAFSSAMYFKNNAYNAEPPIHEGSYQTGQYSMSALHFPTECDDVNVRRYTDPDREYTLADGLATTDAKGDLLYWPNQTEFNRAYAQAVCGYTWNSWPIKRVGWSSEIEGVLQPSGTSGAAVLEGAKKTADSKYEANTAEDKEKTVFYIEGDTEKGTDYRGWHQFVLSSFSNGKDSKPTFDFGKISDNDWWTICLPFSLTRDEIKEVYGDKTTVCTLKKVERDYQKTTVTLIFTGNLMSDDAVANSETGEKVIEAGKPYMIKPSAALGKDPSTFIRSNDAYMPEFPDMNDKQAYKIIKTDHDITATKVETVNGGERKESVDNDYVYKFIGSFMKYYIPMYAYFLAWDSDHGYPAYFFQSEMAAQNVRNWNPYTCVIAVNWDNPTWVPANPSANTVAHWATFTIDGNTVTPNTKPDGFPATEGTPTTVKVANMLFGDNGGTTGVNTVHTATGTRNFAAGKIYNLNGQLVGEGGDLSRLPKGVYVINGKKYISK